MMNKLKKSHFATCLGVTTAYIEVNIKRGKIICKENLIDISNQTNRLFIDKMKLTGKIFDLNRLSELPNEKKTKVNKPNPTVEKTSIVEFIEQKKKETVKINETDTQIELNLQEKKLKLEIIKLENQNKKDELQIKKLNGELIPVDASENIFIWAVTQFQKTFENSIENITAIYSKTLEIDNTKMAKVNEQIRQLILEATKEAKESILIGLENAVNEYSEVRGRGERK